MQNCKLFPFFGVSHTHEPHCAVQEAVEQGEISKLRFDSYLKLLKEIS
ncbi:MAG: putative ribosome biogenesis GTPase RsgA [Chlamydiae bacterium]|nr:putative ribosome biogenesis GTPase RsgA [Chlamydiota bacterium]